MICKYHVLLNDKTLVGSETTRKTKKLKVRLKSIYKKLISKEGYNTTHCHDRTIQKLTSCLLLYVRIRCMCVCMCTLQTLQHKTNFNNV